MSLWSNLNHRTLLHTEFVLWEDWWRENQRERGSFISPSPFLRAFEAEFVPLLRSLAWGILFSWVDGCYIPPFIYIMPGFKAQQY